MAHIGRSRNTAALSNLSEGSETGIFCAHGEFKFGEFTQTKGTATGEAF
jgi:hypothetical protein